MQEYMQTKKVDVVVVGAGASGIPAAVGAARAGAKVLLVEEDNQPGGAFVDQYVAKLAESNCRRGGVFGEIFETLMKHYNLVNGKSAHGWSPWFLPADYLKVVSNLIRAEPGLELLCGVTQCTPLVEGETVSGILITLPGGEELRVEAAAVIDATGSAEMAALASCETVYGREGQKDFDEPWAPEEPDEKVQLCTWQYITQNLRPGECSNMAGVGARPLEAGYGWIKEADDAGWERNTGLYLHWGCRVRCSDTRDRIALAKAQQEALALMAEDHRILRENGYAIYLAPKLGVRESRRLVGECMITANDLVNGAIPEDTVFVTQRGMDVWTEGKPTMSEYPPPQPYGIPYRALVPKRGDGILVVGKALSGTHLAMSAYRTQSILGPVGEAAGVAAAMCAQAGCRPRDLDTAKLRAALRAAPHNIRIDLEP